MVKPRKKGQLQNLNYFPLHIVHVLKAMIFTISDVDIGLPNNIMSCLLLKASSKNIRALIVRIPEH